MWTSLLCAIRYAATSSEVSVTVQSPTAACLCGVQRVACGMQRVC